MNVPKVVAITGASSGIGRATARLLAKHGHAVVLGARREEELAALMTEINDADVMVNNAGIGPLSRFDALHVKDWDAMIDVNLRGTLHGIAAAVPVFSRQGTGRVINIISTAGIKILPTMGVYAATKNAVRTVTEALRQEAGPNLRVTEISPGMVATNFGDSINDSTAKIAVEERMKEIGISPDAIARGILFALDQPPDVEIGSIVIRPTAQG
jgi:NADP-dependent 3-hydroxy acid dehydrogenase YdfG